MNAAIPLMDKLLEKGVLFLLFFTPLVFGTVQKWSVSMMEIISFLLLALLLIKMLVTGYHPAKGAMTRRTSIILMTLCLLFAAFATLQLLPLPANLLGPASPEALRIHTTLGNAAADAWQTISINPYATRQDLLLLLSYAAVFTIIANHYRTQAQVRTVVTAILSMGVLLVIIAVLQKTFWNGRIFWFYPVDENLASGAGIWGPYINRNHFAGYLEIAIPLALGMLLYLATTSRTLPGATLGARAMRFLSSPTLGSQASYFLLVLAMTAALFATLSRGGIIACTVSFCCFVWLTRSRRSLRRRSLLLVAVALALTVVVVFASWDSLEDRFELLDTDHVSRLDAWRDSLGILRDYPLTGSGLGTFEAAFRRYQTKNTNGIFDHTHNDYLELLTDTGPVGFALVALALALFFTTLYRRWRRRRSMYAKCLGAGGLSSCCAMAIHSFTDFNLHIPANALLFTVVAALTYAVLFNVSDHHGADLALANTFLAPVPVTTVRRLLPVTLLLLLTPLTCMAMTGLMAERHYAAVDRILDNKQTGELDLTPLLPETAPRYVEALQEAMKAQRLEPSRALYSWTAAEIATRMGLWASAMELLKEPLPAGVPSREQAFTMARSQLQLAISADPTNPDFHLALAGLYENRYGDPVAAQNELRRAVESFPNNAAIRLAVARHQLAADRKGDALEQLRLLAKLDDSYQLPESSRKAGTLETQPGWYRNMLYRSNLYAALDMAWRITRDPQVVKGLIPEHSEAKIVLQAFLDAKWLE
ncbi:MAG: O-antigen ligase family protein [Pedobacter sp.]